MFFSLPLVANYFYRDPQWYRHAHAKDMPIRSIARLIQTMLYARRFFPYYVYNILGGIEEDGKSLMPDRALDLCCPSRIRDATQLIMIAC